MNEQNQQSNHQKETEQILKLIIDNSPFPIAVVDEKDNKILFWSKSAILLFGHDPKTTEEWYELAYPDPEYRNEVIERWKPFLETAQHSKKAINTGEYNIVCKNGLVKICELHAQIIPGSLIVTLNDITEKKKAEEKLKAVNQQLLANEQQLISAKEEAVNNEKYYHTIINNMGDPVFVKDDQSRLVLVNDAFCGIFELEREAIIGKTLVEDVSPGERESFLRIDKQVIKSGQENINEESLTVRGGESRTISTRKTRFVDKNSMKFLVGVIRDISDRKKSEEQLKVLNQQLQSSEQELMKAKEKLEESAARQAAMIENIGDVIAIVGADGMAKYQSPNIEKWFGWKPEEIVGNGWDKMHPQDIERIQKEFAQILESDKPAKVEYRFKCKNGNYKWIEVTAVNRINDPAIDGILINYHDITERKQSEEQLKAQNQQLRANEQQLRASNQQLQASEQQLSASNQQLQANEQQLKSAKISAEENAEKLELALHGSGAGLWSWNIKTGEDLLDERWCGILGYKQEEIEQVVSSWERLIHPDEKEHIFEVVNKHFEDESNEYNDDYRMKCKNGDWKWIHAMGRVVKRDKNGEPELMSGIIIDIDAKKQTETQLKALNQQLLANEQQLRATNQQLQASEQQLKASNQQLQANEQQLISAKEKAEENERFLNLTGDISKVGGWEINLLEETLRWTEETFRIHEIDDLSKQPNVGDAINFYHPDDRELVNDAVNKTISTGEPFDFEARLITVQGREKWVRAKGTPVIKNGEAISVTGIFQDITDKKKAEIELLKAKKTAERYLDMAGSFFVSLDRNGDILLVNQKALEILDYDNTEELIGKNWFDTCIPSEIIEQVKQVFAKVMKGDMEGIEHFENEVVTKSGQRKLIDWYNSYIKDEKGQVKYLLSSGLDITERKKSEKALRKIEWMLSDKKFSHSDVENEEYVPAYGDLTHLNTNRLIHDSLGAEVLKDIASDYLSLLDTSSAIYEKNGDYALGIFSSGWCRFMDQASFKLCNTDDSVEALNSGKWLCHESCWKDASLAAINTGCTTDIECSGGIRLYAEPIRAGENIVGAINFGYGNPPQDHDKLLELAQKYNVPLDELIKKAKEYETRPSYMIELAKTRLQATSKLIGEIVSRKMTEQKITKTNIELVKTKEKSEAGAANITAIIEGTENSIWAFNRNYEILYINHVMQEEFLQSFDVLLEPGTNLIEALPEALQPFWKNRYDRVLANEQYTIEDAVPTLNGTLYIEIAFNPIVKDGQVIGGSCFGENITARKLAEIELIEAKVKAEESEIRLKLAQDLNDTGTWDWNIESNSFYWSEEYLKLFGLPLDTKGSYEVWQKCIHPDDLEMASKKVKDSLKNETGLLNDYRIILPTGEVRWIRATGETFYKNHVPKRMIGLCYDISDIKQAEMDLLEAKEKAEESDRLKSAFLANMSHEIRTPMNGILGFTDLLKDVDLTGNEREKYIKVIERSGERMLNTINDIIDIARIESGEVKVNSKPTNINTRLENLYEFFKLEAEKNNIALNYKESLGNHLASIQTDPEKFDAIFINLIKNALKFTPKGSIDFGYRLKDEKIHCYVKDTGIGIASDKLESVFERFIQEKKSDTSIIQGSGLGLSIVKAYVGLLGGKIWLESEEGKGSTFHFTLPYNAVKKDIFGSQLSTEDSTDMAGHFTKKTILLVEDDDTSYEFLKIILSNLGVNKVVWAKDGEEAIKQCKENTAINLVLMDVNLPAIDGYEATKVIKAFRPNLPIIAQTAYALTGDREKSLAAGCDDYITKPIKKEQLLEKMEKLFDE